MTFRLLALLIALLLVATVPQVRACRNLRWFGRWVAQWHNLQGAGRVALVLAPPAVVAAVLGIIFSSMHWLDIVWLAFAVFILVYTLGPRYLEDDIDAVIHARDRDAAGVAAQDLRVHADDDAALPLESSALVEASVLSALKRRFGIVFWFCCSVRAAPCCIAWRSAWASRPTSMPTAVARRGALPKPWTGRRRT